ncbi:uncharacterized protein LOC129612187 [Condylostylus longicornis]|uniref:uncharacterized protein LOC129612187 n=1 Tax=Condylostylus longicornis TaxID=2530218 RepID=UPI00244DB3A3|nr:uncharacterized protein LOC129612187 [Condylostylus longicornis]
MDILKKMFSKTQEGKSESETEFQKDEFRKPAWYEEDETDDELFGRTKAFQIFTNPIELQKHFERQMQEMMKSIREIEENGDLFDRDLKNEYLKPGYEKEFKQHTSDTDLDGEINSDQLHSLVQRVSPELDNILSKPKSSKPMFSNSKDIRKLADEEKILGKIHGSIIDEEEKRPTVRKRDPITPKFSPHFGGVFEGTYQGPKMFGQSVVTHTILKPDGTYETKRVVKDSEGNIKTTVTRTRDGKSETVTTYGDGKTKNSSPTLIDVNKTGSILASDRNIYVSKKGYALPMNLW